jgi:dTDP-4-amino-4,6-dideoxygalactose transaminase
VWTSTNSFVASANSARYCGARVDFVDIDPRTRNMSIDALESKLAHADRAGARPDLLVPVDFGGTPCDLREMRRLADRYGFRIMEDASHAVGATYQGLPVGSQYSDLAVFSFHPVKIITTAEGGLLTTRNDECAERLRSLRSHGITRDSARMVGPSHGPWYYEQLELGYNYRLTDLQAALGASQLKRLDELQARRQAMAHRYDRLLEPLPLVRPYVPADRISSWHLYVVEIDEKRCNASRAAVFQQLRDAGVAANVHYIPIHLQPYYRKLGFNLGDYPVAEHYYTRALTIPLYPDMTEAQQDHVVSALAAALKN